jgi:oligoendopeptidase F
MPYVLHPEFRERNRDLAHQVTRASINSTSHLKKRTALESNIHPAPKEIEIQIIHKEEYNPREVSERQLTNAMHSLNGNCRVGSHSSSLDPSHKQKGLLP